MSDLGNRKDHDNPPLDTPRPLWTDAAVRAARSHPMRQVEYPVGGSRALALRVSPGGTRTWTLRYRTRDGYQRRQTLGQYPEVGLADARVAAAVALGRVAAGSDPAKEIRTAKAAAKARTISTVAELFEGYFEAATVGRHRPNARPKRPRTLSDEKAYFSKLIAPRFGSRSVLDLTRAEVQRFIDDIGRTAPATARLARNLLRQAFNFAIRREMVDRNCAQFIEVPRSGSRDRVLTDDELVAVWNATERPSDYSLPLARGTALALRLAMLTLQRGGEIAGLHAREIDWQARLWTIPGDRVKNHLTHVVPLSASALSVLKEAFAAGDTDGRPTGYAFPSPRDRGRPINRHSLSRAMKRLVTSVGIANAVVHDLRRTGATAITGERIGIPRFIVSRTLNQISDHGGAATVTAVYDRNEYLADKRRALDAWAALLHTIVTGQQPSNKVVDLVGMPRG